MVRSLPRTDRRHTLCLVTTNRHDFKLIRGRIPMATEIRTLRSTLLAISARGYPVCPRGKVRSREWR
jgi:hypothetical protein